MVLEVDGKLGFCDTETTQVMSEIIDVIDRMANDAFSVANQVESIGRFVAMQVKMERDRLKLDSERMCRFDYAWDWIGGGIAETLRNKGTIGWQGFEPPVSHSFAKSRIITPPQDTRAKVRGNAIGADYGENASDWSMIDTGQATRYVHPLSSE